MIASTQKTRWFLTGFKCINPRHEKVDNCSTFVHKLLKVGGLFNGLLSYFYKLQKPMTPKDVCQLAKHAEIIERRMYPETVALFEQQMQSFGNELLAKSTDKMNPTQAVDDFLRENADFCFRINSFDPKIIPTLLPLVYRNIQQAQNERLLELAENFTLQNADHFLLQADKLLKAGANLSLTNIDGFNPLHVMIKHQFLPGIKLLLDKQPQMVNSEIENKKNVADFNSKTALDLALETGNEEIIHLLKQNSGMTKKCKDFLKVSSPQLHKIFNNEVRTTASSSLNKEIMKCTM